MRTVKITHVTQNITHVFYSGTCDKCKKDILLPEPYYAWYIRTVGHEPCSLLHSACGGPELDDDYYVSLWWGDSQLHGHTDDRGVVKADTAVCSAPAKSTYDNGFVWGKNSTYVYGNTFYSAHKALKEFIIKDSVNEQRADTRSDEPGTVEQSEQHRPQVYQAGELGTI